MNCVEQMSARLLTDAFQVAGGAAEALLEELGALGRLSGPGAAQLAADLDYFCNVLAALGVALSPPLLTWQARRIPKWMIWAVCCAVPAAAQLADVLQYGWDSMSSASLLPHAGRAGCRACPAPAPLQYAL